MDMSMQIPFTWDFPEIDMVIPTSKGNGFGDATQSNNTANLQMNFRQGSLNSSLEIHVIPKLQFGIDVLDGFVSAELFLALDTDGRLDLNATIQPDFAMDGCTTLSAGFNVNVGGTSESPVSKCCPDLCPSERIPPQPLQREGFCSYLPKKRTNSPEVLQRGGRSRHSYPRQRSQNLHKCAWYSYSLR